MDKAGRSELDSIAKALNVQEAQRRRLEKNIDKLRRKSHILNGQMVLPEFDSPLTSMATEKAVAE